MPRRTSSSRTASPGIFDAFYFTQGGLGYAPVAIFLFAAAHSMRRHEPAPAWLAWLGYLAAFGAAIATLLDLLLLDSIMAPSQPGPVFRGGSRPRSGWWQRASF